MPQDLEARQYDVLIVGAGPAGCACALTLKDAGLKVALLDKATFPRDKVCGDAIPGRAIKTLKSISPAYEDAFRKFANKCATRQTAIHYKGRSVTFKWVGEAYTCTRMEFDNFLFSLVKEHTDTAIYTDTLPHSFIQDNGGFSITSKNSDLVFHSRILVGADGAQSAVAKKLANRTLDRQHHVGSVRAYFKNVANLDPGTTEIYFDKKFLPSYLWVFPLPGNMANVGFGMLSSEIAKKKINLKTTFYDFVDQNPALKLRFRDATQTGDLEGFGLPLGSRITTLSGNHFMLVGDAASLIDPFSGDGIGNAMLSGKLAAEQAVHCFKADNFTAPLMSGYDRALTGMLGKELRARHKAQRTLSKMPFLLDTIFTACRSNSIKRIIQKGL